MPRTNRVDPWGDLHAVTARGTFTGNRGCLVGETRDTIRHHVGTLWITCVLEHKDWNHPLDAPRTWTPLFFLDDAVALAAGHRPCGLCRRDDYLSFRNAIVDASSCGTSLSATDLNRMLHAERLRKGRGLDRAHDRIIWIQELGLLPPGTVIIDAKTKAPMLITARHLQPFTFDGWGTPVPRPQDLIAQVLTPPTSVAALDHGFLPHLHNTAATH